jgi:hypothetical protein
MSYRPISALGLGGSELDVKSLRYGRVIIMTDADDGILSLSSRCICTFSELFLTLLSHFLSFILCNCAGCSYPSLVADILFIVISESCSRTRSRLHRTAPCIRLLLLYGRKKPATRKNSAIMETFGTIKRKMLRKHYLVRSRSALKV